MVEEPCARKLASTVLKQRVGQRCPTRLYLNPYYIPLQIAQALIRSFLPIAETFVFA